MRDLLPREAKFQSGVGRDVMSAFERFGYERVWLPTFEFAEVLERTRGREGSALRFIEPETGEVVALRSDMTPQIARVVATRFGSVPRPLRLCYQGSVVRRRKERARTESQVVQAGVELVGRPGPEGDFEVIELLAAAVSCTGLSDFVLDLGHSGIARELMRGADPEAALDLRSALAAKDHSELERAGKRAGLGGAALAALVRLPELHGAESVWPSAEACLAGTAAEPQLQELHVLWQRARERELAGVVLVDLGETRELEYYTGPVFQLLAHGPGEPVASGGRYDGLYDRFGAPSPAAGFAIDLNHLCWALGNAGRSERSRPRVVASEGVDPEVSRALRALGVACASAPDARAYAAYWRYEFVLEPGPTPSVTHLETGERLSTSGGDARAQANEVVDFVKRLVPSSN